MRPRPSRQPKRNEALNRGTDLATANVRFEVFHNGHRVARAGIPGSAVLAAALTWVRRDPDRQHPAANGVYRHELFFRLGGLDSNDPERERHVRWPAPLIRLGDRLEIRIADDPRVDQPADEYAPSIKKRPHPPPEGDPARVSVKDAVIWPAPSGVHLQALNMTEGGPVTLTPREAATLARALVRAAATTERKASGKRRPVNSAAPRVRKNR